MNLPSEVSNEIQSMLDELKNEYPPLLETDLTREKIAEEFNLSQNGAKGRAAKMIRDGKWIEVMKRSPAGSKVATYQRK